MSCSRCQQTCAYCDPGIEAFYQQKVAEAKESSKAYEKIYCSYPAFEDALDTKWIWWEYCEIKRQEEADDAAGDGDPSQWTY